MIAVIFSVLIFGLVHPLSKVILDSGIPLSYFCLLYVGIRFIVQLPIIISRKNLSIRNLKLLPSVILFGVVGAGLQYFEFKAIDEGLSPAVVTFLMFTYPVWLSVVQIFKHDKSEIFIHFSKVVILILGMYFVSGGYESLFAVGIVEDHRLIYPLLAGLCVALWILLSNRLRRKGLGIIKMSFYYDLFAFIFLVANFSSSLESEKHDFMNWVSMGNITLLFLYSICVGLIPNLLFYYGSKKLNPLSSGTLMAFEPICSTVYSIFIWSVMVDEYFLIGAFLIFIANIPLKKIREKFERLKKQYANKYSILQLRSED